MRLHGMALTLGGGGGGGGGGVRVQRLSIIINIASYQFSRLLVNGVKLPTSAS